MTDDTTLSGTAGTSGTDKAKGGVRETLSNGLLFLGLLVFLGAGAFVGWLLAISIGFRLWASWLGHRVDGSMLNGTLWGLSLGFVCTLIPLIIARQALRRIRFVARLVILVIALAIALPNIATLTVHFGSGKGAHAGQRILDVDAPGVVVGTYVGMAIAVGVFLLLVLWGIMRWNDKRKTRKLSRKLAEMAGDAADSAD
ncbi:hypothetical protein [Nocardioides jiangxiensis]|uniref:Permease n=1 Tax=Nocardioides jiangxiensis TaxID=3064524 RepID=A0ABT9AXK9_9ACTN|nr:hypothetical protein [Nocardioides sp. WY-20]MDO7867281.1 hypothetical protein [Nocardioides sp. WY-20]